MNAAPPATAIRGRGEGTTARSVKISGMSGSAGAVRAGGPQANAWRWQARDAVVTEGFVSGQVYASYLHTHWNGVPGAAARITAAAGQYQQARARG